MNYVQIENGQIVKYNLPQTGYLKNGQSVSGYNLLDAETLKQEGWLPLIEEMPVYNSETQYLQHDGYVIETERVISRYKVVDIVIPEPQPTPIDPIEELRNENLMMQLAIAELSILIGGM